MAVGEAPPEDLFSKGRCRAPLNTIDTHFRMVKDFLEADLDKLIKSLEPPEVLMKCECELW